MKKKVGIVTWYCSKNYGSQLQAYALLTVLERIGFKAYFIKMTHYPIIKAALEFILYRIYIIRAFSLFALSKKRVYFTKKYLREIYLDNDNPSFATLSHVICGSDQIWAPNVFSPYYMLDFVPNEVNKISYAASIGLEYIPDNLQESYKKYVGRINYVSVRENKGQELLKKRCGIDSKVVLDPTLLLDKEGWNMIKVKSTIEKKYIFCYFLRGNHNYKKLVKDYAEINGCEIYGVSDNEDDSSWMNTFTHDQVGPSEFIGMIEGSQCVITDSYHGTIFSMIYHKPFLLFERFSSSDTICQNSRIEQLKTYFGIDKSIVRADSISKIEISQVNYDEFENTLAKLREGSINFLTKALN